LIISIIICQSVGLIGALFTRSALAQWYVTLKKPWFTPPNWLFAPVWSILYALMGMAVFLVWRKSRLIPGVKAALGVFMIQLILNMFWPIVFFGQRSIPGGFVIIVFLWLAIIWTIRAFWPISKLSAVLLLPYIAWVSFAMVLNYALFTLNQPG